MMKTLPLVALTLLLSLVPAFAENSAAAQSLLKSLLNAIETNSVEKFVADGEDRFKTAMTAEVLSPVSAKLSPRLKTGTTITYLGELHQRGYEVHIWRIQFKDGGDDVLAKLSMKDGKVGGFWLQ